MFLYIISTTFKYIQSITDINLCSLFMRTASEASVIVSFILLSRSKLVMSTKSQNLTVPSCEVTLKQ